MATDNESIREKGRVVRWYESGFGFIEAGPITVKSGDSLYFHVTNCRRTPGERVSFAVGDRVTFIRTMQANHWRDRACDVARST